MAPPNWATSEQLKFLRTYIPIFVEYTVKENQSKFWPRLCEDWFGRWPELDVLIKDGQLPPQASASNPDMPDDPEAANPRYQLTQEERELYGLAIQTRKQKLQNWIRNNNRKMAGASKVSKTRVTAPTLGLLNPRKRQRMHQEQEIYHHLYKDKLETLAKTALAERLPELQNVLNGSDDSEEDESDADSDGQDSSKGKGAEASSLQKIRALRMKIRREVRAEAWANETAEVRQEVKNEMMREREGVAEINGEEKKVGLERSAESQELVISNLMGVLKDTCAEIYRLCGWSTIVLTGGPHPTLKNKISLQTVTFGQTAAGNSFNESYAGFQNEVVQPYLAWLKNVYADPLQSSALLASPPDTSKDVTLEEDDSRPAENNNRSPTPTAPLNNCVDEPRGEEDENPFYLPENRPVTPVPEFHSQNDSGGPSEPISWAFRRQGLGDVDSPMAAFGEENSSTPRPPPSYDHIKPASPPRSTPSFPTVIKDVIDPALLQPPLTASIIDITPIHNSNMELGAHSPPTSTQTSDHPLTGFSLSRPQFIYRTFLSPDAAPATANIPTNANTSMNNAQSNAPITPPLTSPRRGLAAATILASLATATPSTAQATALSSSIAATPPTQTGNSEGGTQPRGRGHGRGRARGRGGHGGRGRRLVNENAEESTSNDPDVQEVRSLRLSPASRRRIDALNKRVYPPDGAAPGPPLGALHSINVNGMYPCITFQAPPPTAALKKRSRDVVSEADIVSGKRARKEHVRVD